MAKICGKIYIQFLRCYLGNETEEKSLKNFESNAIDNKYHRQSLITSSKGCNEICEFLKTFKTWECKISANHMKNIKKFRLISAIYCVKILREKILQKN